MQSNEQNTPLGWQSIHVLGSCESIIPDILILVKVNYAYRKKPREKKKKKTFTWDHKYTRDKPEAAIDEEHTLGSSSRISRVIFTMQYTAVLCLNNSMQ